MCEGRIARLEHHLERLADGCRALAIGPLDIASIRAELTRCAPASGKAVLKLIVTRGSGTRGYLPSPCEPNRILAIDAWPDYPSAHYTRGVTVGICEMRLARNSRLAGLKHLNRLEQVLARGEWQDAWQEGLLLDCAGELIGGTMSNVFLVRDGRIETPDLSGSGVRGVMRRTVIETCRTIGLAISETRVPGEALARADEIFLTNALFGIWPVSRCEGRSLGVGPTTRRLMAALEIG